MKSKITLLALITIGFTSCSKYSGPAYNSPDPNPTKTEGTIPENFVVSKKVTFLFDGVPYEGTVDVAEKRGFFGISFQRNGIKHSIVLSIGSEVGKYGTDQGSSRPAQFQISKVSSTPDTAWRAYDTGSSSEGFINAEVTFSDGQVIVVSFDGNLKVYPDPMDPTNTLENTVSITEGKISTEFTH